MQVEHVGGGIFELGGRQRLGRPVGGLLRLGDVDFQHFLEIVLKTMPVRVGAGQPRGDLGAEDRCGRHAEGMEQNGDIETAVVKNLLVGGIGQHADEVRGLRLAGGDADDVSRAIARRKLDDAETVAARHQPQRFRVDGDRTGVAGCIFGGNIAFVIADGGCHVLLRKFPVYGTGYNGKSVWTIPFYGSFPSSFGLPLRNSPG
ncbi:hypothetical protein D3C72_1281850 [compost metagenome]